MKSEIIYQTLRCHYCWRQNKYVVENCFVLNQWEADFFVVTKSGYGMEFEVREKLNYDRYLCDKFYYYWLKEKREREFAQRGIDNLKNEIKHLKTKIA